MCLEIIKNFGKLVIILIFGSKPIFSYNNNIATNEIIESWNRNDGVKVKIITLDKSANKTGDSRNFFNYGDVYNEDQNWDYINNPKIANSDYSLEEPEDYGPCLLDSTSDYIWVFPNGSLVDKLFRDSHGLSLDFSHSTDNAEKLFEETTKRTKHLGSRQFVAFSGAANHLTAVPFKALSIINDSLNYLTLRGNNFASPDYVFEENGEMLAPLKWASFPLLKSLKELDISNCSIQFITAEAFANLQSLEGLYLGQNKIIRIPSDVFTNSINLRRLDLSYNDVSDSINDDVSDPSIVPYRIATEGVTISEFAFKDLKYLILLDMSHTKISPYSTRAFSYLGSNMQFLSLCFTTLSIIPNGMFANTNMKVMDLSGNPGATLSLRENSFMGIEQSLEILSFEDSRLRDVNWLKNLAQLKILKLSGNNINILHRPHFFKLKNLQLLDLSSNHIGNWYHRVFDENDQLKLLNLRDNNINILTSEMYRDFSNLSFLALGRNDFVCNCLLRDLIDIAVQNIPETGDVNNNNTVKSQSRRTIHSDEKNKIRHKIELNIMNKFVPLLRKSHRNIKHVRQKFYLNLRNWQHTKTGHNGPPSGRPEIDVMDLFHLVMPDGELLQFNFQLLDYEPGNYWCFNSSTNAEHQFAELDPCEARSYIANVEKLNTTHFLIIGFTVLCIAVILIVPLYLKWWYIKYFFVVLKNSTALKIINKEKGNQNLKTTAYTYDIFVSYCDRDREWVLEELLPQIEGSREISICLHERDFQVGLSILENIISCMDKSRCFLLVISKCFLSSQWCQFEMYLAQHRLFETRKEHLILIILEEIPRHRRPKALQYLMQIKTYIKWPNNISSSTYVRSISEERKQFWIRLKRSLLSIEHNNNDRDNESTV